MVLLLSLFNQLTVDKIVFSVGENSIILLEYTGGGTVVKAGQNNIQILEQKLVIYEKPYCTMIKM